MMSILQGIRFYTTVNHLKDLPKTTNIEVAFAGRSNAGKSSAINTLTRRNRLAFVSKMPGRTQHINYFQLNDGNFLVDLPGYGYAKVPQLIREHWRHLLSTYLQTRSNLVGLILIMDVRHPLTELDQKMLEWFSITNKPVHILLSKSDKLSRNQSMKTLKSVQNFLLEQYPHCTAQLFSNLATVGVEEALQVLSNWFKSTD